MYITFTGNPRDRADNRGEVTIEGITFPLNVEVKTPDTPNFTKLRTNSHFSVRSSFNTVEPKRDVKEVNVVDPNQQALDDEKTRLIALAVASDIKVDKRWSIDRIREAVEAGNS